MARFFFHTEDGRSFPDNEGTELETLALRLVDHAGARARRGEIHAALRVIARFFEEEASALARVRLATGFPDYPVPQLARDLLFTQTRLQ